MVKKITMVIAALVLGILFAGCDATGSLSDTEESLLMDFLVNENYIDEKAQLSTDGVGEGELHNYYCNVTIDGNEYILNVRQKIRKENSRVFEICIKDGNNNIINSFSVCIDRETGAVSLYEE